MAEEEIDAYDGAQPKTVLADEQATSRGASLPDESIEEAPDPAVRPFGSKKALWAYSILCFSTGPTSSMVFNYVSAAIQSAANLLGHQPGSRRPCARRGRVECLVRFGASEVDYNSYVLYLRAIGRAMEGVVTILTAGYADYSDWRKTMMMASIFLFGALALPFAGLAKSDYAHLTSLSVLYCLLTTVQGVYTVIEASYIPIFMRSAGWFHSKKRGDEMDEPLVADEACENRTWRRGFLVSVLGLVSSNVGSLVALLIGVILVYGRGTYVKIGYSNYLLAITIGGCLTIVVGGLGLLLLPSIHGRDRPKNESLLLLPVKGWYRVIASAPRYPEAFKLCIGWILWNTGYSNHLTLVQALFLEVTGISSTDGIYQVWSFTNVVLACLGSLTFLFAFSRANVPIKTWAYVCLATNIVCVLWGCIGVSKDVTIGYKHAAEFWVQQVLFMTSSSALRSYNRTLYSSLVPKGSEAQFFGLEITLDLATGWINPLVQGAIQSRTHNLRFPMIPNLILMLFAVAAYVRVDVTKGIQDAKAQLAG